MKTFQQQMLDQLAQITETEHCDAVQVPEWANTGQLLAQAGIGRTIARLSYRFNSGHNVILFNDRSMVDATDMTALFAEHEDAKIVATLNKWQQLIHESYSKTFA